MARTFGEAFLGDTQTPRIVALELPRAYRDAAAEERTVVVARYVRCTGCLGKGCGLCSFAGWNVGEAEAKVVVPSGATPGTRITVPGAGHMIGSRSEGLTVEIVEPGPRAEDLRAAERDYEGKLAIAWRMDSERRRRGQRALAVAGAFALALVGAAAVASWYTKPGAGEPCAASRDCRSGACIRLLTVTPTAEAPRLDALVCTSDCKTDLDCPSSMHCTADKRTAATAARTFAEGVPAGRACIPNGY